MEPPQVAFSDLFGWVMIATLILSAIGWGLLMASGRIRRLDEQLKRAFVRNGVLFVVTMTPAAVVMVILYAATSRALNP